MKSNLLALAARLLLLAPALGMLAGCDRLFEQKGEQALAQARQKEKEGDYRAAIQWYEASLDGTARTAEAQYDMALIFDDKLDNPVAALDHFRRYIELAPHGRYLGDAQAFAKQDEFKLLNLLSKGNFMPQNDAAALKNQNLKLQQDLTDVKKELADMRAIARESPGRGGRLSDPEQKPIPPGARTYEVQPGDTLSSISKKFYKTRARWQDIQDANLGTLGGTVKLKVGMTLVIPRS